MSATVVSNGVDPGKLWDNIVENIVDGAEYLKNTASNLGNFIQGQASYLRQVNPRNIAGGARALFNTLKKGDLGALKDWVTSGETPFIAKAAGLAASAGGFIVGGIAAGAAAAKAAAASAAVKVSAIGISTLIANAGVSYFFSNEELVSKAENFVETAQEVDLNKSTKKFIEESIKKIQELLKSIASNLAGVAGRTLARVVIDQVGKSYLEVDSEMLGILSLTMSKEIMDDIKSSLLGIAGQIWSLGKTIATQGFVMLSRDWLVNLGVIKAPNDKEEFTISGAIKKTFKQLGDVLELEEWQKNALGEGGTELYQQFWESLGNRAGILDENRRQHIRFRGA